MFLTVVLDYFSTCLCNVILSTLMVLMYVSSDCEDDCNLMSQTSHESRLPGLLILLLYVCNGCEITSV